jgi:N utilization substance protein B
MKSRTRARSVALQVLYEIDLSDHPPGEALSNRLGEELLPEPLGEFARQIVLGVYPLRRDLDQILGRYAPDWPLEQIAAIDRNILRVACWEFAVQGQTPVKVAINEAVELAKLFGSDSAPRFVNGVLGSVADHQDEIGRELQRRRLPETEMAAGEEQKAD